MNYHELFMNSDNARNIRIEISEITIINFVYPYWLIIRYFYLNLQMQI